MGIYFCQELHSWSQPKLCNYILKCLQIVCQNFLIVDIISRNYVAGILQIFFNVHILSIVNASEWLCHMCPLYMCTSCFVDLSNKVELISEYCVSRTENRKCNTGAHSLSSCLAFHPKRLQPDVSDRSAKTFLFPNKEQFVQY